jgi:hypothetical protein
MAGRGPQSFKKRQKEQQRKEKQQEKASRREERKNSPLGASDQEELRVLDAPYILPEFQDFEEATPASATSVPASAPVPTPTPTPTTP